MMDMRSVHTPGRTVSPSREGFRSVLTTGCSADYDHTVAGPVSIDRKYVRPDPLPLFPISSPLPSGRNHRQGDVGTVQLERHDHAQP
jgi:hypothetical protein